MTWFKHATIAVIAGIAVSYTIFDAPAWSLCAGAFVIIYLLISGIGVFAIRLNYYCDSVCRGNSGNLKLALTFDDGPDPEATPALLDVLKAHGAHATFFCTGEHAEASPAIIRRIVNEGHTLGNHSYGHKWWTNFLTGKPLNEEILRAQKVLTDISGRTPAYYRSPMGLTNPHLGPVLREAGLKLIGWDVRPYDRGTPAEITAGRVVAAARDGSIVLLHDGGAFPEDLTAAVTGIIKHFKPLGYTFVSLDQLFGDL